MGLNGVRLQLPLPLPLKKFLISPIQQPSSASGGEFGKVEFDGLLLHTALIS